MTEGVAEVFGEGVEVEVFDRFEADVGFVEFASALQRLAILHLPMQIPTHLAVCAIPHTHAKTLQHGKRCAPQTMHPDALFFENPTEKR